MSRATKCGVEAEGADAAKNGNVINDPKIPTQSGAVDNRRFITPARLLAVVLAFKQMRFRRGQLKYKTRDWQIPVHSHITLSLPCGKQKRYTRSMNQRPV